MANRWIRQGLGLDISKKDLHACLLGQTTQEELKVIAQRKFANSSNGYKKLLDWLKSKRKDPAIPLQIVLEVTGVYHEGVLYFLYRTGFDVSLQLPKRTKRYLESIGHKSKTDKLDGRGLARLACERRLKKWEPLTEHILELRSLIRHRQALIKSRQQFANQLHALNHSEAPVKQVITSLKQLIKKLEQQRQKTEQQIIETAQKDQDFYEQVLKIVDSLKGIGLISLLGILSETNGFKSFNSIRQLVSYAGLDIIENQSGQHQGPRRISKQGNARIRHLLYMPALTIIKHKVDPFYSLYDRLLKRTGGIKMKAVVAIQRKLLSIIYTLWKKNEAFIPGYAQLQHQEKGVAPI